MGEINAQVRTETVHREDRQGLKLHSRVSGTLSMDSQHEDLER